MKWFQTNRMKAWLKEYNDDALKNLKSNRYYAFWKSIVNEFDKGSHVEKFKHPIFCDHGITRIRLICFILYIWPIISFWVNFFVYSYRFGMFVSIYLYFYFNSDLSLR